MSLPLLVTGLILVAYGLYSGNSTALTCGWINIVGVLTAFTVYTHMKRVEMLAEGQAKVVVQIARLLRSATITEDKPDDRP